MKANQKFRNGDDAVSPVIAVILMVAITVVLAATVYVWVSGFGNSTSTPAKSLSLTSAGQEAMTDLATDEFRKQYTVASASTGLTYQDMKFQVAGADYTFSSAAAADADKEWSAARAGTAQASTAAVRAGDVITVMSTAAGAGSQVGKTLQILDPNANSIMLTLTIAS